MLRLTASYEDERDLTAFINAVRPFIHSIRPILTRPASKNPNSRHYRRYIMLDMHSAKSYQTVL